MSWGPVAVTVDALAHMVDLHGLGRVHPVLSRLPVWADQDTARQADAAAWAQFARVGWLEGSGRLTDDAVDRLSLLVRPDIEYAAWCTDHGRTRGVLVAGGGGQAAVAVRDDVDGHTVVLRGLAPGESLSMALMRRLPDRPAARMDSLNVRLNGEPDTPDACTLARLGRLRLIGQGEVYVGVRDGHGRYRANTANPIRFADYRRLGRVLLVVSPEYLSVAPCSKSVLHRRVQEAHDSLAT